MEGFCRFVTRDAQQHPDGEQRFVNLSTDNVRGLEFNVRFASESFGGNLVLQRQRHEVHRAVEPAVPRRGPDRRERHATSRRIGSASFDATYRTDAVTFRYGLDWTDGSSGTYDYFAFDAQTGTVDQAIGPGLSRQLHPRGDGLFPSLRVGAVQRVQAVPVHCGRPQPV